MTRTAMLDNAAIARVFGQIADLLELGVTSLDELEAAARAGRIRALPGLGEKREESVLRAITRRRSSGSSMA